MCFISIDPTRSPYPFDIMKINKEGIQMSICEAFQLLYEKDNCTWRQVTDSLIDIAQQKYWDHHGINLEVTQEKDIVYIENGIDYSNGFFEFLV